MTGCPADAGGRDNVTAIVVDVESDIADAAGADETTLPRDQLPGGPGGANGRGGSDLDGYGRDGHGRR